MEKKKKETIELDDEALNQSSEERVMVPKIDVLEPESQKITRFSDTEDLVDCLTNEIVVVRFISRARGNITDPKHILFGGLAPNSKIKFPVPMLRSGFYADVLTKSEMKFLEWKLGLEPGALGVYKRENNFWDDSNPKGIGRVELTKGDNYFDKSKPLDYIRLAILRKYEDIIAPSLQVLQEKPKATYRFVMISENDTAKAANTKVTLKQQAYMEFGKINDNKDKLRVVIEIINSKPTASNSKLEFLQGVVGEIIETNTKLFLNVVRDPLFDNKVLIKRAIEAGIIANRGNYLYYKETNSPLCGNGQEPTLNVAAKFLSLPKNQELKFSIEAKLKEEK
jgi:hypothetical protein